jgi:FAD/FMN-containing dehydrogenase
LGEDSVLTEGADTAPFLRDHRGLYQGSALAVALPRTVQEVSRLLAFCNERRIAVVPHGGNTSYCGGATPDESGTQLVVALKRLDTIRAADALNYSITAEAGCLLAQLRAAADGIERFFPLRHERAALRHDA